MKPSLPKIDPPANCAAIRGRYADLLQNQNFIREVQTSIDDFGPYIQNQLEADLKELEQTSSPQYIFKSLVKFVRVELRTPGNWDWLTFAQVSVFDEKGANISQGKQTTASSVWDTWHGSDKAVNGQISIKWNGYHSGWINGKYDVNSWWQVDLGNPSIVSRIVIQNRPTLQYRLAKYDLLLLNSQREVISRYPLNGNDVQSIEITPAATKRELIDRKLRLLRDTEVKIQEATKCLNVEINQRQSISSEIYNLNQDAKEKEKDVKKKHENVKAAKERAELLQNPYEETTVWESWFPMGRPLERGTIPVLWFLSIVFLTISFGLFLQMVGVNLEIPGMDDLFKRVTSLFSTVSEATKPPASNIAAEIFRTKE
jgi:hypothetical protein